MDEQQLQDFEARARADAAGAARAESDSITSDALLVYLAVAGAPGNPLPEFAQQTLRTLLVSRVDRMVRLGPLRRVLLRVVREGLTFGMWSGLTAIGRRLIRTRVRRSPELRRELNELGSRLREDIKIARLLARTVPLQTFDQLQVVLAAVRAPVTRAERTAAWVANRAIAEGAAAVSERYGLPRIWIAERDACLHCLAYAGEVAQPGQPFAGGLTFGDRPLDGDPVWHPPLHPNCRCRTQPWAGSEEGVGDVELPAALKREAQRTVALGWANASEPARLRAADRLLGRADLLLAKTVVRRSRKAITDRRFIDRRRPR